MEDNREITVTIASETGTKTVSAMAGETVLTVLSRTGTPVYSPCGGGGRCGKCRVKVTGAVTPAAGEEQALLTAAELAGGSRLACRTRILGNAVIYPPKATGNERKGLIGGRDRYGLDPAVRRVKARLQPPSLEAGDSIVDRLRDACGDIAIGVEQLRKVSRAIDFSKPGTFTLFGRDLLDYSPELAGEDFYGVAVDVGTTTLVCYLLDLTRGVQLAVASGQNPQASHGADIVSRINYTLQTPEGLGMLRDKVVAAIDRLIRQAADKATINPQSIYHCVLVGNTTMSHMFWGLACKSLASLPFNAVTTEMITAAAADTGLREMNGAGKVTWLPGIAGYVGADTVGAMLAAGLDERRENILLIDLGTNGEIVLATPGGRYVCSTAAGPAFEGARISCGMQAFAGAIDRVRITDDVGYTTIGREPARGICGSALIDLAGEMLRVGLIDRSGRIVEPESAGGKLAGRIVSRGRSRDFVVAYGHETASGEAIVLTQHDIRELQLAKGAIRAGINILLKVAGVPLAAIDSIMLAGAFGNFVDVDSALRIGLLPASETARVVSLGNAAGEGAKMALCDQHLLGNVARELAAATRHLEISAHPDFQDEFVNEMYFGQSAADEEETDE